VAVASADTGEQVTWRELEARVGRTAAGLRSAGLGAGDRVAVIADNHPRVFEFQFAAMRAGVIVVPLNWRLAVAEMGHQCTDADVVAIAHDSAWASAAGEVAATSGIGRLLAMDRLSDHAEPPMGPRRTTPTR